MFELTILLVTRPTKQARVKKKRPDSVLIEILITYSSSEIKVKAKKNFLP
jgi:hypothetical protein